MKSQVFQHCLVPKIAPLALALVAALPSSAAAQSSPAEARAYELLGEAEPVLSSNLDEYCAKVLEARKTYPSARTWAYVGVCMRERRKYVAARRAFRTALELNEDEKDAEVKATRKVSIEENLDFLDQVTPKVRLRIGDRPPEARARIDGVDVELNASGELLHEVDPGRHTVVVLSPGFRTESRFVALVDRQIAEVVVELVALPHAPLPSTGEDAGATQRTAGLLTAATGALSLGVAGGLGLAALSKRTKMLELCDDHLVCSPDATQIRDEAVTLRTGAYVALGIGSVATIAGVVLYATAPEDPTKPGLSASIKPTGLSAQFRW